MNTDEFLLIIDGSSLLSTQFCGNLPREVLMAKTPEDKEKFFYKIMQTSRGVYTNGIYGFLRTLFNILEKQKPSYIAVTWDVTRDTFRRELYEEYKANRTQTMEPLKKQFILCQDILKRMGIVQFMSDRYEADDFSGSLAHKFEKEIPVKIMTKDHDYLQLINDNTSLWLIMSDQKKVDEFNKKHGIDKASCNLPKKTVCLDRELVKNEFGIYPESVASLKGLMGDSADNIKGVPGIGDKTATALIAHYENIDALYDEIKNYKDAKQLGLKWKNELGISRNPYNYLVKESETEIVGEKAARLSEKLATIVRDIEIPEKLEDLRVVLDKTECLNVLSELEISSLKVPTCALDNNNDEFSTEFEKRYVLVDNLGDYYEIVPELKKKLSGVDVGIAVGCTDGEISKLAFSSDDVLLEVRAEGFILPEVLKELLQSVIDEAERIFCFDFKLILSFCKSDNDFFDCAIAHYLLEPLSAKHDFNSVLRYLGMSQEFSENEIVAEAYTADKLWLTLQNKMSEKGLLGIYNDIEKPLVGILAEMEEVGICCSSDELEVQKKELEEELLKCEKDIYELAGEKFNILSPKQLGEILFVKLGIPGGKKTKTGYSTGAEILEKLAPDYEIISRILYYRQLSKLISTYLIGLKKCIMTDGRIHCTFRQTVTATGRLSCTEPNLQNIPVRDELGRRIRKAFVPEKGKVFVDADYSQIELRILAHMAGDEKLLEDYRTQRDVHRSTAANVFGVSYDEVTKEMRQNAKAVNFGIVYGISSFGLGQDLNISRKKAEEYIDSYFKHYPAVKEFLDGLVTYASQNEYVKTLYGRIRPVPEISSPNFNLRNAGERIAMNSPIQGTAADIMKMGMIRVYKALKDSGLDAKMILQIHDEIIIETKKEDAEKVRQILIEEMTNAAKLKVSLEVSSDIADNWYDLK